MTMALLPSLMHRHPCHCQAGIVVLVTMALSPLICKWCCCPCCDGIVTVLKLASLPSLQWHCLHHRCHHPHCLLASWHQCCLCASIFAAVTMAIFGIIAIVNAQACLSHCQASIITLVACCQASVVTHIAMALVPSMRRVFAIIAIAIVALMMMVLLPLLMRRRPCRC
jgi:hypothetical protein